MRQTRKLRGGATPIQIRANQTRSSSKSGRRLPRKMVKRRLYESQAAENMKRIMKQIEKEAKGDAKALKKMERKLRNEEAEDAEALEILDREFSKEEKLKRKKQKGETNNILDGLFSRLTIK